MSQPPSTPAERFAAILRGLSHAVVTRGITGQLSQLLVTLVINRIRGINQRIARLAARIHAGRYKPRRSGSPRRPAARRPRERTPLPQSAAWLLKLVPDEGYRVQIAGHRAQLEHLLRDPEMAALLQAAPEAMRRPVRSLCRMLGVTPPPALALPAKPRPPRPERATKPRPPARPEPPKPSWWQEPPRLTRWPKGVPRRPRPA